MQSVISPQLQHLLAQHQLASFEQLWGYQGDWFEPPNYERGGWSGVNFIELTDQAGKQHGFYLKRQLNHTRRTWQHPIAGEPTFVREFEILRHLAKHNVATPKLIFFESQQNKAILLTQALTGFESADKWLEKNLAIINISKQRLLSRSLAAAVKGLHQAKVVHRSLYLKHLFIKETNDEFEIALIDFEKSRISSFTAWLRFSDLVTLHYRTKNISVSNKLTFFKQYFGIDRLTGGYKFLVQYCHFQSLKKRK